MSKTALSDEQNNNSTLFTQILKVYQAVYSSQNKGASAPQIKNETVLLDSGLDSLGHAILITRLEEKLDNDKHFPDKEELKKVPGIAFLK